MPKFPFLAHLGSPIDETTNGDWTEEKEPKNRASGGRTHDRKGGGGSVPLSMPAFHHSNMKYLPRREREEGMGGKGERRY